MRIGIVISEFDQHGGGMGQWSWHFIAALAQLRHEVHIFARRFSETPPPRHVVRHVVPSMTTRMEFALAAARRVRELELDVVHDMGAGWDCDVFQPHGGSNLACMRAKLDMHSAWFRALKRPIDWLLPRHRDFVAHSRRQYRVMTRRKTTLVALSQTVADDFVRIHGASPEQIAVVYNGVDCRRFTPENRIVHREAVRQQLGVREDTTLLLLAAHNFWLKGLPELLAVAGRLAANRRPLHVAVVGGKRLAKWQRMAARKGVADRVTFVGAVPDLVPFYAAADVFVHPTYYDPCSLVVLEAAASGLPIVTTRRHNGAAELFRDGSELLTVNDPYDADALFECVDTLFDERLRAKLGAAAREVAMRHTFDKNVAEILRLYERIGCKRLAA